MSIFTDGITVVDPQIVVAAVTVTTPGVVVTVGTVGTGGTVVLVVIGTTLDVVVGDGTVVGSTTRGPFIASLIVLIKTKGSPQRPLKSSVSMDHTIAPAKPIDKAY